MCCEYVVPNESFEHVFGAFTLVKKGNDFSEFSRYAGKRSKAKPCARSKLKRYLTQTQ